MHNEGIDDGADRLNHLYATSIFIIVTVILDISQFVGTPIQCFTPKTFSKPQTRYTHIYCWTASTYQVVNASNYDPIRGIEAIETNVMKSPMANKRALRQGGLVEDRDEEVGLGFGRLDMDRGDSYFNPGVPKGQKESVNYYQWLCLILPLQAAFFYFPYLFWTALNKKSGIDLEVFMNGAKEIRKVTKLKKRKLVAAAFATQFDNYLKSSKRKEPQRFLCIGGARGNSLSSLYIFVKALYLINVCVQLHLMKKLYGADLLHHAWNVLSHYLLRATWVNSITFPINTLCEIMGQPQIHGYLVRYTIHCLLPINLYNDKIFAVLTLFLGVVTMSNLISFGLWLYRLFYKPQQVKVVSHLLKVNKQTRDLPEEKRRREVHNFIDNYLRKDGVFLIRLIDVNHGRELTDRILLRLWFKFMRKKNDDSDGRLEVKKKEKNAVVQMPTAGNDVNDNEPLEKDEEDDADDDDNEVEELLEESESSSSEEEEEENDNDESDLDSGDDAKRYGRRAQLGNMMDDGTTISRDRLRSEYEVEDGEEDDDDEEEEEDEDEVEVRGPGSRLGGRSTEESRRNRDKRAQMEKQKEKKGRMRGRFKRRK